MPASSISASCRRAATKSSATSPRSTPRRARFCCAPRVWWGSRPIRIRKTSLFLQQSGLLRLGAIVLPGLADAVVVAREADLEQLHLFGRDRLEMAQR